MRNQRARILDFVIVSLSEN